MEIRVLCRWLVRIHTLYATHYVHAQCYLAKRGKTLSVVVAFTAVVKDWLIADTDKKNGPIAALGRVLSSSYRDSTLSMNYAGLAGGF